MTKLIDVKHRVVFFACCLISIITIATLVLSININSQQLSVTNEKDKKELLSDIQNSSEIPFNIIENEDTPFKITQATVKEISGSDFTKLTGRTTNLTTVSSFPEVKLQNISNKTITSFFIVVRNATTTAVRGFLQSKVAIAPGQFYEVNREQFCKTDRQTVADDAGVYQKVSQPQLDNEKYWLDFEKSPDVFVTVPQVTFEDGSKWRVSEGGQVR